MRLKPGAGHRLHQTRERLGLSRKEVEQRTEANHFKVSEATIANIEKGISKNPYPRSIYALADAYNLDPDTLLEPEEVVA